MAFLFLLVVLLCPERDLLIVPVLQEALSSRSLEEPKHTSIWLSPIQASHPSDNSLRKTGLEKQATGWRNVFVGFVTHYPR